MRKVDIKNRSLRIVALSIIVIVVAGHYAMLRFELPIVPYFTSMTLTYDCVHEHYRGREDSLREAFRNEMAAESLRLRRLCLLYFMAGIVTGAIILSLKRTKATGVAQKAPIKTGGE